MKKPEVDSASALMAISVLPNVLALFFNPIKIPLDPKIGAGVILLGLILFFYSLKHLKKGVLGATDPILNKLIKNGPYRFIRHPHYLSFIIILIGYGLFFKSLIGIIITLTLFVPSTIHRSKIEDKKLKKEFGKEWENYSEKTGLLLPKP